MSAKLDKSLDDLITSDRKSGRGGGRGRRGGRGGGGRRSSSNGTGGGNYANPLLRGDDDENDGGDNSGPVRRERRQQRSDAPYSSGRSDGAWNHDRFADRAPPAASPPPAAVGGTRLEAGTKVLVTNLDASVGADDIKEIFQNLGNVAKAVVHYDQNARSLGSAEVTFSNTVTATRAVEEYDGAEVDGRPMTLKLLSGVAPPPKNVVTKRRERVTAPTTSGPRRDSQYGSTREDRRDREDRGAPRRPRGAGRIGGGGGGRGGARRGGRGGGGGGGRREKREPAPTGASLDADMDAYQSARGGATAAPAAASAGQPAAPAAAAAATE